MTYDSITVTPVTPRVGAEIEGINLSKPLSNRELEELHGALLEYQVLFFRDQLLNEERHPADLRAAAAKQIVFELFNIEDGEQIIDGARHKTSDRSEPCDGCQRLPSESPPRRSGASAFRTKTDADARR